MEYNINFCIISAAYLFITAFFYGRQARIPNRRSVLFDAMLWCGVISLILDIVAAVTDHYSFMWPSWLLYIINIVFLLSVQVSGVLFFYYSISLTGTYQRMGTWLRALIILPFASVALLILSSIFTKNGIFYLDENNAYHHGSLHIMLYAVMAFYLICSLVIVLVRRRRLQKLKLYVTLAFLLTTLTAMLIQLNNPYLLVNSTANAFALTLIYHILEAPSNHVDALTGVLNRSALSSMLRDTFDEGERCTLLVYSLNSLHLINHSLGMKGGDAVLAAFADYLKKEYPRQNVIRTEGDIFSVMFLGGKYLGEDELSNIYENTRRSFEINSVEVALDISLSCINSEDCDSRDEMSSMLENIMRMHRGGELGSILLADGDFKMRLLKKGAIERATAQAINENRVEVYYQPIHDMDGRLCALEALVRINDSELGFLPPQELVELAEKNGSIIRLGEQVLRRSCEFFRDNDISSWGLHHVGVNLSAIQCARSELSDEISKTILEFGISPELIAFEVTETAAGALTAVRKNMDMLRMKGINFLLDDFGTGYANFKNMVVLPFRCIKIDKSLLWNAQSSRSRMMLLSGVVKVIHSLGLTSLCEGVETLEQVELLRELGVSMMQGYHYSKPLPPERLIEYAKKEGVC